MPESGPESCPVPLGLHHERGLTLWGHKEVHTLQYIQEELIPAILDALPPPADLPSHLAGDLGLLFFCLYGGKRQKAMASLHSAFNYPCLYPIPPSSSLPPSYYPVTHFPLQALWGKAWRKWSKAARAEAEETAYLMLEATGPMWCPQETAGECIWEEGRKEGGYEAWILEESPSFPLPRNTRPPEQPILPSPQCRRKLLELYSQ